MYWLLLVLIGFSSCVLCNPAAHSHAHRHGQHEREQDGAHVPVDHMHYQEGEHHSEFDHEAILGSRREAEEFDELPPSEAKRRLGILVKKIDSNQDGFIDDKELYIWIQASFKKLSAEEAQERLEEVDLNHDGYVTWNEHFAATYGDEDDDSVTRSLEELDEEEKKFAREEQELFTAADKDNDGKLTPEEFFLFNNPEEHEDMLDVALKHSMKEKDKNADGAIDFTEYLGSEGRSASKEDMIVEKESFDTYDRDKDGVLSGPEVSEWLYPNNDEIAREETSHLISEADDNSDNKLSYQEIIDNHEVFVGSEATQYGDTLHMIDEL